MKSILDHELISYNYFFPRVEYIKDPYIVESHGCTLACYYHHVASSNRTIVHFHGNGETSSDYLHSPLKSLGCSIFFAEYRGYGMSSGEPALVSMLDNVEAIITSLNIPMEEIILFGRSVGSIYAIHGVSLFSEIGGLIIESGISNVAERVLIRVFPDEIGSTYEEIMEEGRKYFDHQAKLEEFQGKTLIIHTKYDSLVPSTNALELHGWANEPKELKLFINGDHNDIMAVNRLDYLDIVKEFIESMD